MSDSSGIQFIHYDEYSLLIVPNIPLYQDMVKNNKERKPPLIPEELEYHSPNEFILYHKTFRLREWFDRQSIHECIQTIESCLFACNEIASFSIKNHSLYPQFKSTDLWILDTGSILWIPSRFTSRYSSKWILELSKHISHSLLDSKRNVVHSKTIRELLGSIPITYTLERMTYNEPYRVII